MSNKETDHSHKATLQGRVVGSDAFQDDIGSSVGRRLKGETARVHQKGGPLSNCTLTPPATATCDRGGNAPTAMIEALLRRHVGDVGAFCSDPERAFLILD